MSSITEVARSPACPIATASRVVSEADYPVSAATRERVLEAARTLDYVPNALARGLLKQPGAGRRRDRPRHHRPVLRARSSAGVEDAASPAGFLVITCSSERDARPRALVRPAAALDARRGGDLRRLRPRRRRRSTRSSQRHLAAMRAEGGGAVVHLSPHAGGRAGGRRRQRGRHRGDGRGAGRAGPPADRVPRRAAVAVRRARAPRRATGAGSPRPGSSSTSAWSSGTTFDREGGALGVDELLAARRRVHRDRLRQRPARARARWPRLAGARHPRAGRRVGRRASTTSRSRRSPPRACPPSACRCASSAGAASRSPR